MAAPPGFWGKLPASGDFVGRGLPASFIAAWDRLVSRHLVGRLAPARTLCFLLPAPPAGPMTGVVVASADRAGRRFPLTLAAALPAPGPPDWYAALAALGREAAAGDLDPVALEARLAALPPDPAGDAAAAALLLWTPGEEPRAADPEAPGPLLDALLGVSSG